VIRGQRFAIPLCSGFTLSSRASEHWKHIADKLSATSDAAGGDIERSKNAKKA
jgi:hypothetical protein